MNDLCDQSYQTIRVEQDGATARITLNRPDKLNAMNPAMANELHRVFDHLQDTTRIRVVMLRGEGRHFCAGFDLENATDLNAPPKTSFPLQRRYAELIMKMRRCPQPVIALVTGAAAGAGFAIALAADVRYASDDAKMNVAMSRIGLTGCDMGISYFLPRAVGSSNAAELMMTGRFVSAEKALRIGLVSDVTSRDQIEELGMELAREMALMSPLGLRFTKEGLNLAQDAGSLEAAIALEDRGQVLTALEYLDEGVAAFKERRPPDYTESE